MKILSLPYLFLFIVTAVALLLPTLSFAAQDIRSFQKERAGIMKEYAAELVSLMSDNDTDVLSEMATLIKKANARSEDDRAVDIYQDAIDEGHKYAGTIRDMYAMLYGMQMMVGSNSSPNERMYAGDAAKALDDARLAIWEAKRKAGDAPLKEADEKFAKAESAFFKGDFNGAKKSAFDVTRAATRLKSDTEMDAIEGSIAAFAEAMEKMSEDSQAEYDAKLAEEAAAKKRKEAMMAQITQLQKTVEKLLFLLQLKQSGVSI